MAGLRSPNKRQLKRLVVATAFVAAFVFAASTEGASNGKVLIVGSTVWTGVVPDPNAPNGPGVSVEQAEAELLGFGVDVADDTTFKAMTSDQIAGYEAIVFGDPG